MSDLYLAITKDSIHHEGDERSRTHPGHGYPAWTEEVDKVHKFTTQRSLIDWLKDNSTQRGLEVYFCTKVKVTSTLSITLD